MGRVYNFSAGPAVLPLDCLLECQRELLDYDGTGMSIIEMSHRTKTFEGIVEEAKKDLKELLNIPDNYKIIFVQGGATLQFSCVPLNLMKNKKADYILTGEFSEKAYNEAKRYGDCVVVASSKDKNYSYIPDLSNLKIREDADYVYICDNNTIYGTKYKEYPDTLGKPLVADMSSSFLSQPIDVSKFGVIFAGAQKNVGPSGLVILIIREDLIRDDLAFTVPTLLKWKTQVDADSMYNTPNTFSIYMCSKVFKWLKSIGGLEEIEKRNKEKAKILYDYLDNSKYISTVEKSSRSLMNVPFKTKSPTLDELFIKEAKDNNIVSIKGHRKVGGMRASIYNAMPISGVEALVDFMKKFEKEHLL